MSSPPRTLLVACSDRLFLEATATYMDRRDGWRVVAACPDGVQALAAVGRLGPTAVLAVGELDRVGVSSLAKQVRRRWPEVTVVAVGVQPVADGRGLPADSDGARIMAALASSPNGAKEQRLEPAADGFSIIRKLTVRERMILRLMAEGKPFAAMARELGVSQHTIRTHAQNLYSKLDCHSRLEVVRFAARYGLLDAP